MHGVSNRIALKPALALLDLRLAAAVLFFLRDGINQLCAVSSAGKAHVKVVVFDDIMDIPSAKVFKDVAFAKQCRAAKEHKQFQTLKPRQDDPKPRRIFRSKTTVKPIG